MKLARYARTLRHLTPGQIGWRVVHELRLRMYRVAPAEWWRPDDEARVLDLGVRFAADEHDRELATRWQRGFVRYLSVEGDRDDWQGAGRSRLWRYERHYHRELAALAAIGDVAGARAMATSWMGQCPPPRGDAWEPYPVARRLLNWSIALANAPELGPALAPHLSMQLRFLDRHLERHLLGNHLLCDASGLVAAGSSLADEQARAIATRALRLLEHELARQTLPDGGYAERTVHYHALVWHDAKRACALAAARGLAVSPETQATLARMEQWLATVRRRDGSWPALNDSVPVIEVPAPAAVAPDDVELADTGWTLVRSDGHELLFEHGDIGPDEQPGHGHSDALSYELVWDGRPVVVDTGMTTYDVGPTRDYERSARAHGTVTVDDAGADELWGSFRVGARGRCVGALARREGATRVVRGTLTAPAGWRHERVIAFRPGEAMVVHDRVVDARRHRVVSRVPLHPDCALDDAELRCGELRLQLTELVGTRGATERGWIGDGFGARRERAVATFDATADGVCSYAIAAPHATRSVAELFELVR